MADLLGQRLVERVRKKKRSKRAKVGTPAHDDLVRRDFSAPGPNRIWLSDITQHLTREGKLYLCAVKDVWSNRIVGYSMAERMESSIRTWPHARVTRQVLAVGGKILRGEPKTDAGVRVVVLDPATVAALKSWSKVQAAERLAAGPAWGGDPEIFTNSVGRVTDPYWVTKRFRTLVREAGLPIIRLHDARHTAASQWLAAGVPLKDVSGLLVHSSLSITADTYGHVLDDSRQAAARAMAARLEA